MTGGSAGYSKPFEGRDGKWYFHLEAANGEVVMVSEGYDSKANADRGVGDVKRAAREAAGPATIEVTITEPDGESHLIKVGSIGTAD